MRPTFVLLAAAVLGGCAMTSGYAKGPHGNLVYHIDGMSAGVAYKKADEKCPNGYDLLNEPRQTSPVDYVMTIECK